MSSLTSAAKKIQLLTQKHLNKVLARISETSKTGLARVVVPRMKIKNGSTLYTSKDS